MCTGVLKKILPVLSAVILLFIASYEASYSWGFYAHKKINRMAVFILPPSMVGFYKKHLDYITVHAVDADKRRHVDAEEAARHYIDIDHYGDNPFDALPLYWNKAVEKYGEDTLKAYGIVPWHIHHMLFRLTAAFKEEDPEKILFLSANLGHYVGDAFVPLHTTVNYNGQLTGQHGIHGFWESRIPELKANSYNYFTGKARYLEHPAKTVWQAVKTSFQAKDSVLYFEAELNKQFPPDKKYTFESKSSNVVKVYSEEYSNAYEKMLNGMIERRMREAIHTTASLWYTAWVNAGQPDMDRLAGKEVAGSLHLEHPVPDHDTINGHDE